MTNELTMPIITHDRWYGNAVTLKQPAKGFRATTDALLLAASVFDDAQNVLELGAGVGAASLALATRLKNVKITAVENDSIIAQLLTENIADNKLSERITPLVDDALKKSPQWAEKHDIVMMNPPYNAKKSTLSPDTKKQKAMATSALNPWIEAGATAIPEKGRLVMIARADRLDEIINALAPRFGDIALRSVHPISQNPAKRILISARKGVQNPLTILPALVLDGGETEAITRYKTPIDMIPPSRKYAKLRLPD